MSSIAISSIVLVLVFGGAMLGMALRKLLPQNHLSDDSKDIVRIAMGLVATMTALVLGLLVSSAKSSFGALSSEITGTSSKIILLDRTLADYGVETKAARDLLRSTVANVIDQMELKKLEDPTHLPAPTRQLDSIYYKIQGLLPKDETLGSRESINRTSQATVLSKHESLRFHPMPPWITKESHRPRVSHRTMSYRLAGRITVTLV